AIVVRDAASITAGLPYVRLERGSALFRGRRQRVILGSGEDAVGVLARLREPPRMVSSASFVAHARDRRGRDVPVALADPARRTIHFLLDVASAAHQSGPLDTAPSVLAETLLTKPLDHLLAAEGEPWIGEAVPHLIREMLERRLHGRRPRFEREIRILRRAGQERPLPRPLVHRLEMLEKAIRGDATRKVEPGVAERETERLRRLVESRACGSLRFAADEVRGLVNPRRVSASFGHGALMFSLQPAPAPGGPRLRMWRAGEPEQGGARTMCLGCASAVLLRMEDTWDTYGLVDTVLNFIETNFVGVVPLSGPLGRHHFVEHLVNLF
ncbi:hypothetical protein K8I85_12925, partial [bacterium]|nr:hypothetical protein [bacterium]